MLASDARILSSRALLRAARFGLFVKRATGRADRRAIILSDRRRWRPARTLAP
jgi:hypothetical protein